MTRSDAGRAARWRPVAAAVALLAGCDRAPASRAPAGPDTAVGRSAERGEAGKRLADEDTAATGRPKMAVPAKHFVSGAALDGDFPGMEMAMFGMGCFWGAERKFWQQRGVVSTAAGYAGGKVAHPTYEEVCGGETGHAEVVRVVFDPKVVKFDALLKVFWEAHDPTQGMRQGNDVGDQYRSVIYTYSDAQQKLAEASRDGYQKALTAAGHGAITTEIARGKTFYFAEEYHQQYLGKKPDGYCGLKGTGVSCPVGLAPAAL